SGVIWWCCWQRWAGWAEEQVDLGGLGTFGRPICAHLGEPYTQDIRGGCVGRSVGGAADKLARRYLQFVGTGWQPVAVGCEAGRTI
ncbi:MAG TPA: hypothetical protein VLC30_00840, partial [Pseudomonas sp.]|nr:hypothetical protein [Pseudomonas sp.]